MSPQDTMRVTLLIGHVGHRGRAVSLFTETIFSSSLGGLCTGPEHVEFSARWSDINICVKQVSSVVESRLMGHTSGPQVCVY